MEQKVVNPLAIIENVHSYITNCAARAGISVNELCRRAGVDRATFQRWKEERPRTLQIIFDLLTELDSIEAAQLGEDVATA